MKDLYEILGVNKEASSEEIKKAFYELSKKYHPDKNKGEHSEEFLDIKLAYEVLSDDTRRNLYDTTGLSETLSIKDKAIQFIQEMYLAIIQNGSINLKTYNIFNIMKDNINNSISKIKQGLSSVNILIERHKECLKRIETEENNFFKIFSQGAIDKLEQELEFLKREISLMEEILIILKKFKYVCEETSDNSW